MKTKIIQTLLHFCLKHYSKSFILVQVNNKGKLTQENDITMISNIKEKGLIRILLVRVKNKL